jgi:hypothetical protein
MTHALQFSLQRPLRNARASNVLVRTNGRCSGAAVPVTPLSQVSDKILETGSFASPPYDGFALIVHGQLNPVTNTGAICLRAPTRLGTMLETLWKTAPAAHR